MTEHTGVCAEQEIAGLTWQNKCSDSSSSRFSRFSRFSRWRYPLAARFWVARIGVTRATEACFLTADRQCTELPQFEYKIVGDGTGYSGGEEDLTLE